MININQELDQLADKLHKSTVDPVESSIKLIKSLGKEGLKARLPHLTDEEKQTLRLVLTKAIAIDEAEKAKFVQGKVSDTIIQEDKADDNIDETLVKPAAAKQNHQGSPTPGWEGQVIKAENGVTMNKSVIDEINKSDELTSKVVDALLEKGMAEDQVIEKCSMKGMEKSKVQGAVDKYKKKKQDIEKAKKMSMDQAKEKIINMEEKEHGTKDPKKLVEAEKKEHGVKKSDAPTSPILEEENQVGSVDQMTAEGKNEKDNTQIANDNKSAQDNVNNMNVVQKSVTWEGEDRLLKANTQGRNFHFDVNSFIKKSEQENQAQEDLIKSQTAKEGSIDEMIEKSLDRSQNQVQLQTELAEIKPTGTLVKSFDDVNEIAAILGMTEEEARKILG